MLGRFRQRMDAGFAWPSLPPFLVGTGAIIAFSSFAVWPLFGGGMILTGDTLHVWRIHELGRCIDDGQIPCRWVPDLGNGYGFPLFNYYPPLPYYVGDLLHRLGFSYLGAVNALFAIGLMGCGVSMYAFTRRLWGELGGLVSGVAYVYAPYLALDVYMRGALAELWALAVVPALLWAVYELVTSERWRYVPVVALFAALLLLSHNLMTMIMAPAVALWAVALVLLHGRRAWRPALLGAGAAAWGLGLASFYTLPVLSEGLHVQLDSLARWPFHYSDHFVSVNELFLNRTGDYTFLLGLTNGTPIQIGWFHWAVAGLSLPAALLLLRRRDDTGAAGVILFALLFAAGVFMTLSVSQFVWDTFESLRYLQFPWRYVGLVSLAGAGLAGAWLALLRGWPGWARGGLAAGLIVLFVAPGQMFFDPVHRLDVSDEDLFTGEFLELYREGSITDYLPQAVEQIPDPASTPVRIVDGAAQVYAVDAGSDWMRVRVDAAGPARVQASVFDYPNWRVSIDGREIDHRASDPNGLVTFPVSPGMHHVELRLEDTAVRTAGNLVSLASWSLFALTAVGIVAGPSALRLWRQRARAR